jgi:hypothetical protein
LRQCQRQPSDGPRIQESLGVRQARGIKRPEGSNTGPGDEMFNGGDGGVAKYRPECIRETMTNLP